MSAELSPQRAAALKKWLRAANVRLLSIQRQRQELLATATSLARQAGPERPDDRRQQRPKLVARIAKAG